MQASGEGLAGRRVGLAALEAAHLLATALMVLCALAMAHWDPRGRRGDELLLWAPLAVVGLAFSRAARTFLVDLFSQFQYREKFGLFLIHMLAVMVPTLVGLKGTANAASILIVMLCFQAVQAVTFGRIAFLCGLVVTLRATAPPIPPFPLVGGWMLGLLLAMRLEHVRFRIEALDAERRPMLGVLVRETIWSALAPWGAAVAAYLVLDHFLEGKTRWLEYTGPAAGPAQALGPVSSSEALLWAFALSALIIATIAFLAWLERRLRTRRGGAGLGEEDLMASGESRRPHTPPEPPPEEEPLTGDARSRILERFRRLADNLARLGLARRDGETALEFTDRVGGESGVGARLFNATRAHFDPACYSETPISEADAAAFLQAFDETEPRIVLALEPGTPKGTTRG
jgi:hypothetical protein